MTWKLWLNFSFSIIVVGRFCATCSATGHSWFYICVFIFNKLNWVPFFHMMFSPCCLLHVCCVVSGHQTIQVQFTQLTSRSTRVCIGGGNGRGQSFPPSLISGCISGHCKQRKQRGCISPRLRPEWNTGSPHTITAFLKSVLKPKIVISALKLRLIVGNWNKLSKF